MRAGNAKGTGVPRSARQVGTGARSDRRRELNEFDGHCPQSILGVDEGITGASENNRLGDVDAMNARRQLATAGQRTNLGMGHGPPLASSDGLGHLSDPGDQPGRKPASQPVVGSHGVRAWGVQRHQNSSWLREPSRARNAWWLWKRWGDRRGRWASELSTGLARRQLPRLNCTIPRPRRLHQYLG